MKFKEYVIRGFSILVRGTLYNAFNALIAIVLIIILTGVSQGADLLIDLFINESTYNFPIQLVVLVWLIWVLSRAMYNNAFIIRELFAPNENISWHIDENISNYFITYIEQERPDDVKTNSRSIMKILNLSIGQVGFICFIHALVFTIFEVFYSGKHSSLTTILALIIFNFVIALIIINVRKLKSCFLIYPVFLILYAICAIMTLLIVYIHQWCIISVVSVLVLLEMNILLFFTERIYYPKLDNWLKSTNTGFFNKNLKILARILISHISTYEKYNRFLFRENRLIVFLVIAIGGLYFTDDFLFYTLNCRLSFIEIVEAINPIIIFLLITISIYAFIVHYIKIHLYNRAQNSFREKKMRPYLVLSMIPLSFVFAALSKGLHHQIPQVEVEEPYYLDVDSYLQTYDDSRNKRDMGIRDNSHFVICASGGGLRANYWTLLLLNELNPGNNSDINNRTVCYSGVSGGGIGLANYISLLRNQSLFNDPFQRNSAIDMVADVSVLSRQLFYLFVNDYVREWFGRVKGVAMYVGSDRSVNAFRQYSEIFDKTHSDFKNKSFYDYWTESSEAYPGHLPALVLSATSTSNNVGIVQPLCGDSISVTYRNLVSTYDTISPTYYGIVSTTNRFPFLDPAAYVKNRGHYLDGGYFDNSGILASNYFINFVLNDENPVLKGKYTYLLFDSDKRATIAELLNQLDINRGGMLIDGSSRNIEVGDIVTSAADTYLIPSQTIEFIEKRKVSKIVRINLPARISESDIRDYLKGEFTDVKIKKQLETLVTRNNNTIDSILINNPEYKYDKWGIVEPALSRSMSKPAKIYMKSMLNHPTVRKQITAILN